MKSFRQVLGIDTSGYQIQVLLDDLRTIITAFPQYQQEAWYKALDTCYQLLLTLPSNIKSREDLAGRNELKPFAREGIPFTNALESLTPAEAETCKLLITKFNDLENC